MDQIRFGKFLAALRRREGLTQEALGEKLGVTNKTISRWENGNYMPDIEMIGLLADIFGIRVEDLLTGTEIPNGENHQHTIQKKNSKSADDVFSIAEKKAFYIRKWRREHIALFVVLAVIAAAAIMVPFVLHRPAWFGMVPIVLFMEYCYQNNQMMMYVEKHLYGEDTE